MTAVFSSLVGQDVVVQTLSQAAGGDGMTHAWLFTGPAGSGRSVAARAFAAALQCRVGPAQGPGCGECHDCRTVLSGSHADVLVEATEATIIPVARARELALAAAVRPVSGRWRILIVEDADRLNEQASDALLKALEEPPAKTVWLLCAPSVEDLLVTVRSRCRHVRLRTPPVAAVAELLQRDGVDAAMAHYAARAAQSHVGIARRLAADEGARGRRREVTALPLQLTGLGPALRSAEVLHATAVEAAESEDTESARRAYLAQLGADPDARTQPPSVRSMLKTWDEEAKRRGRRRQFDAIDAALTDLASVYRDALVWGSGVPLVNDTQRAQVEKLAAQMSPDRLLGALDAIGLARQRLVANGAALLVLEAMMIELCLTPSR